MAPPSRERPPYVIAERFVAQFENIRKNYAALDSLKFSDFTDMWNKQQLNLLTLPFPHPEETIQFLEECFDIIVPFLMPEHPASDRACAIYTLFGLYFNQKVERKEQKVVRIPIMLHEWEGVQNLMVELRNAKHLEPFLALRHLRSDNAFLAVAARGQFYRALTRAAVKTQFRPDVLPKGLTEVSQEVLPELQLIHNEYMRVKRSIASDEFAAQSTVYNENFPEDMRKSINDCLSSFKDPRSGIGRSHARVIESEDEDELDPEGAAEAYVEGASRVREEARKRFHQSEREKGIERAKMRMKSSGKKQKKK